MREPLIVDCEAIVRAIAGALRPLSDVPMVFFGHSLGALLAFEVSRRIVEEFSISPRRLVVTGRRAPHVGAEDSLHDASDEALITYLRGQGGTPREVFDNPELLTFVLPILRADLGVLASHRYVDGVPLCCPISVYGGRHDEECAVSPLEEWKRHTTAAFSLQMLPGGHFFILSERHHFPALLSNELVLSEPAASESGATL